MPSATPGSANRVVRVCRLLNRHRARRIEGVRVPFLALDDLIRSKQTGRPSDEADLEVLRGLDRRR